MLYDPEPVPLLLYQLPPLFLFSPNILNSGKSNVFPRCPYDPRYSVLNLETFKTIMEIMAWSY